jgi:hypothetical protein
VGGQAKLFDVASELILELGVKLYPIDHECLSINPQERPDGPDSRVPCLGIVQERASYVVIESSRELCIK